MNEEPSASRSDAFGCLVGVGILAVTGSLIALGLMLSSPFFVCGFGWSDSCDTRGGGPVLLGAVVSAAVLISVAAAARSQNARKSLLLLAVLGAVIAAVGAFAVGVPKGRNDSNWLGLIPSLPGGFNWILLIPWLPGGLLILGGAIQRYERRYGDRSLRHVS